jgi:hypothetical protein
VRQGWSCLPSHLPPHIPSPPLSICLTSPFHVLIVMYRRYSIGPATLDFGQIAYPELLPTQSRPPSRFNSLRKRLSRRMSFTSFNHEHRPKITTDPSLYSGFFNGSGQSYASPTDLTHPIAHMDEDMEEEEELVTAMHDFVPDMPAATCLTFNAGQIIRVLNKDATGWWDGELVQPYPYSCSITRGWFPSNYVSSDPNLLPQTQLADDIASTSVSSDVIFCTSDLSPI